MKVYLAGGITGMTYGDCTNWRDYAKRKLAYQTTYDNPCARDNDFDGDCPLCAHGQENPPCRQRVVETGIVGFSPMRAKDYLQKVGVISGRPEAYDDYVLSSAKGITYRDAWDVKTADVVLVNLLGAEKVSIGTVWEIGRAWERTPVVVAMEEDNIHNHPILNTSVGWITPDLDHAIDIVKAILLPDGVTVPA